ncbi:hypothetical protein ACRRTK_022004 [Alexandromys fortis]
MNFLAMHGGSGPQAAKEKTPAPPPTSPPPASRQLQPTAHDLRVSPWKSDPHKWLWEQQKPKGGDSCIEVSLGKRSPEKGQLSEGAASLFGGQLL